MAKIIIDMNDDRYEKLSSGNEDYLDYQILLAKLRNATVLPTNATNGDVIKALFPRDYANIYDRSVSSWWNADFKGER